MANFNPPRMTLLESACLHFIRFGHAVQIVFPWVPQWRPSNARGQCVECGGGASCLCHFGLLGSYVLGSI